MGFLVVRVALGQGFQFSKGLLAVFVQEETGHTAYIVLLPFAGLLDVTHSRGSVPLLF